MAEIQFPGELRSAVAAALAAGREILQVYNSDDFNIELKDDHSPLTRADKAAHQVIVGRLSSAIPVLSEEDSKNHDYSERKNWNRCWVVDPLDGTKEFIKRNGEFTVNIALIENGFPVLGVIYVPVSDRLYYGWKNGGAFLLENAAQRVNEGIAFFSVHQALPMQSFPSVFTLMGSRSHSSPETEAFVKEMEEQHGAVDFIAAGSSLKFCLLAEGKAHSYPRFAPTMEWDTAAGQAILEAAGGSVLEWPSQERMQYNRENLRNGWFLASAKTSSQ